MTQHQIEECTEPELELLLFVVNVIFPTIGIEYDLNSIKWMKQDVLIKKLQDSFPKLNSEGHPIFISLMSRFGIVVNIEPAPIPPIVEQPITSSIAEQPITASIEQTGSI